MPRYFFHIIDDEARVNDDEGMELPNLMAAAREAEASAWDLLVHDLQASRAVGHRRIEVMDKAGTVVFVQLLKSLVQ